MQNLASVKVIKEIMTKYDLSPSKGLGQNFLIDASVCPRMAQLGGAEGAYVIEVGPGLGVLTKELALIAKKVVAVELDKKLIPALNETLSKFDNISVINADIMKLDINKLIEENFAGEDIVICANLPYYITSPVIMKLLEEKTKAKSITVMVQREAADRLCAGPGSRQSGAITVAVSYYAEAKKLFYVPASSFYPAPKVDSAVIKLDIYDKPPISVMSENMLFRVIKAGFLQRRKTLINSLSSGLGLPKEKLTMVLSAAGVSGSVRAERLTLKEFALISDELIKCGIA